MAIGVQTVLILALGALGAMLRYAIVLLGKLIGNNYQMTLVVNLLGCLAFGYILTFGNESNLFRLVGIGLLGGFTTFSTFSVDFIELLEQKNWLTACGYLLVSVFGGISCVAAGYALGLQFS